MEYGFVNMLSLLGALGFFIFGMKIMSEGIQKVAGPKMREWLGAVRSSKGKGMLIGLVITALIQSSSATSVLVVSFVNAGLISLVESVSMIMGANIGTTLTAWLIAVVGFRLDAVHVLLPIVAIGTPLLFLNRDVLRSFGEMLIGFALLFLGFEYLKGQIPDLRENPEILSFLTNYTELGFISIVVFVIIGMLLTIILQSSSASLALTFVMAYHSWIPFDLAAAMVLGENIGTTITANLAAIMGNVHARRAAFVHFIFNLFGVVWMLLVFYPFLLAIDGLLAGFGASPFAEPMAIPVALALFHTGFNLVNALILVGFTEFIAGAVTRAIRARDDEDFRLEYIGAGLMSTAELSLEEAQKETARFGRIVKKMANLFNGLLHASKSKKQKKLLKKIRKREVLTDTIEEAVSNYLLRVVGEGRLSSRSSTRVASLLSIINDLERIGDIFYQMSREMDSKIEEGMDFTKSQLQNLDEMLKVIGEALDIMIGNLETSYQQVKLAPAAHKEQEIDELRNQLLKDHLKQMEKEKYNPRIGALYKDLFHMCEKVGDHIINVTEAITGERERRLKSKK